MVRQLVFVRQRSRAEIAFEDANFARKRPAITRRPIRV